MTRQLISETVCFLVKDDEQQYKEVLSSLAELVPYDAKFEEGMYLLPPLSPPVKLQKLNIWPRPLCVLRFVFSPRKKQSDSIPYRLRGSEELVKYLLPQFLVHAALYECSVSGVHAYCQCCRWGSFTKVAC